MWSVNFLVLVLPFLSISNAQKGDTGDILHALKDSGMLEKFEEDVQRMLFEENERKLNQHLDEHSFDTSNEVENNEFDSYEFIKSYVAEKNIKLHEKVLFYLMELVPGNCLIYETFFDLFLEKKK